jgi:hypothetical protein
MAEKSTARMSRASLRAGVSLQFLLFYAKTGRTYTGSWPRFQAFEIASFFSANAIASATKQAATDFCLNNRLIY